MIRGLRELALWTGALLGLLAVVAGIAVAFFGAGFLVFRSGSMGPQIPTGSLALERTVRADQIRDGDVVSVLASNGARVTHRVVTTTLRGDTVTLTLKGDANNTPDAETYEVTSAQRVVASVPDAGYVASYLMSPLGLVVVACLAGMIVVIGFSGEEPPEDRAPPRSGGRRRAQHPVSRRDRARVVSGVARVAIGGVVLATGTTGTMAYFTDPAKAATGAFTATTVAAPALTCTGDGGNTLTITWPAVVVPHYTVTYTATVSNGTTLTVTGTGAMRSTTVNTAQAPGALAAVRNYTVSVIAQMSTAPSWRSVASVQAISTYGTLFTNMQCSTR